MKPKTKTLQHLPLTKFITLSLGLSVGGLSTHSSQAGTIYWDGSTTGNWSDVTQWTTAAGAATPDPASPPAIADDVIFNRTGINAAETISLNGNQAANTLTFNNTGTTAIRSTSADQTLTLASGITANTGAGAVTIGSTTATNRTNVILGTAGANQTWTHNGTTGLTVTNGVAGTASSGNTQTLTINGSSTAGGVTFTGNTTTITDGINGGKLALLVNGSATSGSYLTVGLNGANSYSGGTTITQGLVGTGNALAFGAANSLVTVQGTTDGGSGGQAFLGNFTWLYDFNISGFGNNEGSASTGQRYALRIINGATIGASTNTFTVANAAAIGTSGTGSFTIASKITGTGGLTIRRGGGSGTTTAIFTNANNDYSGQTTLSNAILQLNASTAAQNSIISNSSTANGLTFNTGITAATIGGLNGSSNESLLAIGGAAVALTVGNNNNTGMSYSGALSGAGASLIKSGTGIQTLSGTNTYTGGTTINGGTLQFGKLVSMPASGAVAVNTGSTLAVNLGGTGEWTTGTSGNGTVGGLLAGLGGQSGGTVTWSGAVKLGLDTTNAAGGTQTYSGTIADVGTSLGLTKLGAGTLELSGANTYTGVTSVAGGKLLVNGSNSGGGAYNVGASGTLGGPGSVGLSTINVSGVLSPGASVETLSSGTINFATGSTFAHELNSTVAAATGADLQVVSGDLSLTGTVNLTLADLAASPVAFTPGTIFSLINYSGSWNGGTFTFGGNALGDDTTFTAGLNTWQIDYNAATGGSNFTGEYLGGTDSFVNLTAVPEPTSMLLGGLGLLALLRRHRK